LHLDVQPGALAALEMEQRAAVRGIWGIALSSHLRERQVSARMACSGRQPLTPPEERDGNAAQPGAGLALFADLADASRIGADGWAHPDVEPSGGTATAHRLLEDLRGGATLDRFARIRSSPAALAVAARGPARRRPNTYGPACG
jgi:RNA 3'-terminal phosphate cyclase (ATP)